MTGTAPLEKKPVGRKDIPTTRGRWWHRIFFIFGSIGASIGFPNIWKFPNLTFKHTGPMFIAAYFVAVVVVGWPMHLLESTLGQKMQRGSAGALRGITPRLAGAGWVASFSGMIISLCYTVLLGLNLYYMVSSADEPWNEKKYNRAIACDTAEKASTSAAELFLFFNAAKILEEKTCLPFEDGLDNYLFNDQLFIGVLITWVLIFFFIIMGIKSIRVGTIIVVPFSFIALFVCLGHYVNLNNSVDGKGFQFYLQGESDDLKFPFPRDYQTFESLFKDAYSQVFYSMGICMGVHYAYGSYNHIKKPVILDSFFISFVGFFFSFIAGFMGWGAIGYLNAKNDPDQAQTSSVGLTYIAMPKAASMNDSVGMYVFFLVFMFATGITQVYGFVLGFVVNICDALKCSIWKAALPVCICGLVATIAYTSNVGWILFDMTEHFILRYIVVMVGLLQCISVGWYFEYFTTAAASQLHAKSLKYLAFWYWFPVIVITFYANFGLQENRSLALIVIAVFTLLALVISFCVSKMEFNSWYHEIVLQGVDKLSMSITSLSHPNGKRSAWMLPFETYFGICIKFINPACLLFIFFNNLQEDLKTPYNAQNQRMYMFATIPVFLAALIIIIPIFTCNYPERFEHNVNKEFMADVLFEQKLRMQNEMKELEELRRLKHANDTTTNNQNNMPAEEVIEMK